MRVFFMIFLSSTITLGSLHLANAQDLAPRVYVITPLHSNAITLTWAFYDGSINYNGALPVSGATGTYSVPILSYYHSLSFFGRSANIVASLPYGVGNFQGTAFGALYHSDLLDFVFPVSLFPGGVPAIPHAKIVIYKMEVQRSVGLQAVADTGNRDPRSQIDWESGD